MNSAGIHFNKLVLKGFRKDYVVPFHSGVNIIYGDADTGKSSILRLIDYILGSKMIHLDNEITSSVEYVVLELLISGNIYSIKRDIYNPLRDVEVFSCFYDEMSDQFPEKYMSSLQKGVEGKTSISEFILAELGFPAVEIKQAPSKDQSRLARLSFRDLIKYCYLNQDDVGSKSMMNLGNPFLEVKNKEVFKYIFNVLDSNISGLDAEISQKTSEKQRLESKQRAISEFMDETEFRDSEELNNILDDLEGSVEGLNSELSIMNAQITSNSETYSSLKEELEYINSQMLLLLENKNEALSKLERFSRLQNDYINDISKLKALSEASEIIGATTVNSPNCPICETKLDLVSLNDYFSISESGKIDTEIKSINRRIRDLHELISNNRKKVADSEKKIAELERERMSARTYIDEELKSSVSPYLTERDALVQKIGSFSKEKDFLLHELKVSNQLALINSKISKLMAAIEKLKGQHEKLVRELPSFDEVLGKLSTDLDRYLEKVHIKNRTSISVSKSSFLPVVRGVEYRNINSGGLRTIVSIGYLAILLENLLDKDINHPGFIMIDTVGKYLGKTKEEYTGDTVTDEDDKEGVSDPSKYSHIYEYLLRLANDFESKGKACQVLLVDNDVPSDITNRFKSSVVAHYSSEGLNELSVGLIDDWDTHVPPMAIV